MGINSLNSENELLLLEKFNNRDCVAFGTVYNMFYDDLFYYTSKIYRGTELPAYDVIQDIFLNLWEMKRQKFSGLNNIKAYLFVSIKNNFKDYLKHQKSKDKYKSDIESDDDLFVAQMMEMEVFSFLNEAVDALPSECCKVIKSYLEGYETKEIALMLNKTESTVYNQKKAAIDQLKKNLPKDKMLILMMLLH